LPRLGYVRQLSAEGVLSLRPDLVLATADAGPPAAIVQVEAAGVAVVRLQEAHGLVPALARIRAVGAAIGRDAAAGALAAFDALALLGFGPRLPQALHGLAAALHPGAALPPVPVAWR
jgi:iron complex transport system substrate-binding protein